MQGAGRSWLRRCRGVSEAEKEKSEQSQPGKTLLPELSLDSLEDVVSSRRGFLTFLMACSAALFLATLPFALRFFGRREERFPKVALGRVTDLPLGEARPFVYPGKNNPALLVHLPNGEWKAYEGTCTHLSCVVYWDAASERLICPCHNAAFAVESGAVLMGPPRRPLPCIELSIEGDTIYALGVKT
jgi:nitrite reductase/ring-hydroxylating ferredoxin subunit